MVASADGPPAGYYSCHDDTNGFYMNSLQIETDGTYHAGVATGAGLLGHLTWDSVGGRVTFHDGYFYSDATPAHHFVGTYPSPIAGDRPGTILVTREPGHPNDSQDGPTTLGTGRGYWHCYPA